MGIVEIKNSILSIQSHIITYGNAANEVITRQISEEIETMWNEPEGMIVYHKFPLAVRFRITSTFQPAITESEIYQNLDPRNNYFRIEEFAQGNISFVDGIGSNSGYFKLENLYKGSTTAAHEYGHTLGLEHPKKLDIRGQGVPGIMFPRGTLVDPSFQYDPEKAPGTRGGTLHPMYRKVLKADINHLNLRQLKFENGTAIIGEFTNVWHPDHRQLDRP
jgi:hypothetical protein